MSTRVVVLADTHIPRRAKQLPELVLLHLERADLVIHLGDFTEDSLADELQAFAPLHAVHGNNDSPNLRARFPATAQMRVEGHALTLVHGHLGGRTALAAARLVGDTDAVLFGHSHRAWCSREDGRLLFNPGSPTDRRWAPERSFGILDVGETIGAAIIPVP